MGEHGYVYYEGDCFFGLKNPYIPPDVENPSLAQVKQKKLVGEGEAERKKMVENVMNGYIAMIKGESWDKETLEEGQREMFKDIARERARLGGDWAIAGVLFTSKMREIARSELGSDLEIVMLEMTAEEQEERIRARHSGSQNAVDLMKVFFDLIEPVGESEVYTKRMTVFPDLTPQDVVAKILGDTPNPIEGDLKNAVICLGTTGNRAIKIPEKIVLGNLTRASEWTIGNST